MEPALRAAIEARLGARVSHVSTAAGGSINDCFVAQLASGRSVFVKTRADAAPDTFAIEARGLEWLRAGAPELISIPEVLAVLDAPRALVLAAFVRGPRTPHGDEALGRGLAMLHRSLPEDARFGLDHDDDLATLRLPNAPTSDWPTFYAERRLLPLLAMVEARGLATTRLRRGLERVLARLPSLAGPPERAARLHGDLWSGNAAVDASGRPVLFDPAVFAGHREVDLAMMRLFGGFSERVFDAYAEEWPLSPGHEARVLLHQLLPLLAHVVLFGGSYVASAEEALSALG